MPENSDIEGKVLIRRWACRRITEAGFPLRVLDCFCGSGKMHDLAYQEAESYWGVDKRKLFSPSQPEHHVMVGDNKQVIPRIVEKLVDHFTLYDIDSYSNPWIILNYLVGKNRDRKSTVHYVFTDGVYRGLCTGSIHGFIKQKTGINGLAKTGLTARFYDEIVSLILLDIQGRNKVKYNQIKRIRSRKSRDTWYYYLETEGRKS